MAVFTAGQILTAAALNALATWEAFTAFTPTYANVTLGTGAVNVARYHRTGRKITALYQLTLGTGGAVTGAIGVSLPVAAAGVTTPHVGSGVAIQGSTRRTAAVDLNTVNDAIYIQSDTGAIWTAGAPFVWAVGNILRTEITYDAAT
jgi:hypothetical protein